MTRSIHIFRAGTHRSTDGRELTFSDSDLLATAKAYDPSRHRAPIVIGHPKMDDPAYGWVRRLAVSAEGLEAEPEQLHPEFAEMLKAGRFGTVSASFYIPDSPANPTPGVYALRHVGCLGAQPPAVKGLRPIELAETEEGIVSVEFSDPDLDARPNATLWKRLRTWMNNTFGTEQAEYAIPGDSLNDLEIAVRTGEAEPDGDEAAAPAPPMAAAYTEEPTMNAKELADQKAALNTREAALKEREDKLTEEAHKSIQAAAKRWAGEQERAGSLLPRESSGAAAFLESLADGGHIEFAEDGEVKRAAQGDWFKHFIESLPPRVDYAERSAPDRTPGQASPIDGHAKPGADPEREVLDRKIREYAEKHNVDYVTALRVVTKH